MKRIFVFLFLQFAFSFAVFSEINVISPIEGVWANKQMLIIDTSDGADYFYSLNGLDPSFLGFAYDGPVLIDLTGNVTLRITKGFVDTETKEITFFVNQAYPSKNAERKFINSFVDAGIVDYSAGDEIQIPDSMKYSLEKEPETFTKGQRLRYSENCSFSRYIPCTVTDGKFLWRFVIRARPNVKGTYSIRNLPISVRDWEIVSFDDDNFIYKIDDGFWELPKNDLKLDRSYSHIIYWQDIVYDKDNPVDFFVLPPKPELKKSKNPDGSISFYLKGDESYSMALNAKDGLQRELFTELCVDVFRGDYLKDNIEVAVYSDSVYQGILGIDYDIDKRAPPPPVFSAETEGFHVHGELQLNVRTSDHSQLFVSVSEPLVLDETKAVYTRDSKALESAVLGDFKEFGADCDLVLKTVDSHSTFYKIRAYSSVEAISSDVVEYSVIVDNYDFYLDSSSDSKLADGTREHPFPSFSQFLAAARRYESVNLFVIGNASLPQGKTDISFNCNITGFDNSVLVLPNGASLFVRNSTLQFSNCRLESDNRFISRNAPTSIIRLYYSVLVLSNVDFSCTGAKNNTVIDAQNSIVTFRDSFFSVTATTYASLISATESHIDISSCKVGIVADTSVAFSIRGYLFDLKDTSVNLIGSIGRVSELFGVYARFTANEFSGDLKKSGGIIEPNYCDKNSHLEEIESRVLGF